MRRAELHFTILTSAVVGVGFLLIAVAIALLIRESLEEEVETTPCTAEIAVHDALAGITDDYVTTRISCPTRIREVAGSEDEVKRAIANEMARCWGQWGGGKQLFGDEEGVYCHVCALLTFPNQDSVQGMPAYLNDERFTKKMTYAEFLAGETYGDYFDEVGLAAHASDTLRTKGGVGVIFYYAKGEEYFQNLKRDTLGEPAVGTASGIVTGAAGGYLIAGVVTVVTGGSAVPFILVGAAGGGIGGFITSFVVRPDQFSTMSVVVVRELTPEQVGALGCTYAPVAEN